MKKNIEQKLLSKNTNPTSMRILVYDFLEQQQTAMSLSEIESHFYKADRVTIYRTLKTFEEKGIVHSIQENTTVKYILCHDVMKKRTRIGTYISIVRFVNRQPVRRILLYRRMEVKITVLTK